MHPQSLKQQSIRNLRRFLEENEFLENFSNLLVTSAAIEPYIDPLKVNNYYLPTSPEFALKKALAFEPMDVKGIYEIAHAFRDDPVSSYHSKEFTMIEWYKKNIKYTELPDFLTLIINYLLEKIPSENLAANFTKNIHHISIKDLFKSILKINLQANWPLKEYEKLAQKNNIHCKISNLDIDSLIKNEYLKSEIFTVIFDNLIQPHLKEMNICYVYDFPPFLRGMAELSDTGWAKRVECFIEGLEIASGYQEMSDPKEIQNLWENNNLIRKAMGKEIHPLDEMVIETAPKMKNVSGMALGLERLLMKLYTINSIQFFKHSSF
ncbi:MAG: hypothetical protein OEZ22_11180 [Spirochaetia bacterium]|nr:hypothetical protein [Spirochaetia bacterium]